MNPLSVVFWVLVLLSLIALVYATWPTDWEDEDDEQ